MPADRDILDDFERGRRAAVAPSVPARVGLVVEDRASGFTGDVIACTAEGVTLRDRTGGQRLFRFKTAGFLIDGRPVSLVRPAAAPAATSRITASGSIAPRAAQRATLAKANRIWVEGRHDAELLEHVWGDDLRDGGIVVEPMHGIDDLLHLVAEFRPSRDRRLGILVDHLVPGSKEARLVAQIHDAHVLVTGHPFVDVWAGVRPKVIGRSEWPEVPRGTEWKQGVCAALGVELSGFWPTLRNAVHSFVDLRPELVGAVERLLDFVAEPAG